MDLIVIAALILLGSIVESLFAFFFAEQKPRKDKPMDALTDARYTRLQSDFEPV